MSSQSSSILGVAGSKHAMTRPKPSAWSVTAAKSKGRVISMTSPVSMRADSPLANR